MAGMSYEDFQKLVKPEMLDSSGRFLDPSHGVNFSFSDKDTLTAFNDRRAQYDRVQAALRENGNNFYDRNTYDPALLGDETQAFDPNWRPGVVDTKQGVLGNWGVPLAMLAAPYAAGAMGLGASAGAAGANTGMTLAEQYAAYGAGGGGVTGFGSQAAGLSATGAGVGAGTNVMADAFLEGGTQIASPAMQAGAELGVNAELGAEAATTAAGGSATKAALYGAEGYGPAASPAELAASQGMSYSDLIKNYGPTAAKIAVGALAAKGVSGASSGTDIADLANDGLGDPGAAARSITAQMESDYNSKYLPWMQDQVKTIGARGDQGYDELMGLSRAPNRFVDQYGQYTDRIGSQGYRDQQRAQAMGTVQQQSDAALDQSRRAAMARGVDPSRFALQQNQIAANVAAAKTKAAADAEGMAWDQWGKAAQTAAGLKWNDANHRAGLIKGANDLGQQGANAGFKALATDATYRGGLAKGYTDMYGAQNGRIQANTGQFTAKNNADNSLWGGIGNVVGRWAGTESGSKAIGNVWDSIWGNS